jgi:hypothetical protein
MACCALLVTHWRLARCLPSAIRLSRASTCAARAAVVLRGHDRPAVRAGNRVVACRPGNETGSVLGRAALFQIAHPGGNHGAGLRILLVGPGGAWSPAMEAGVEHLLISEVDFMIDRALKRAQQQGLQVGGVDGNARRREQRSPRNVQRSLERLRKYRQALATERTPGPKRR